MPPLEEAPVLKIVAVKPIYRRRRQRDPATDRSAVGADARQWITPIWSGCIAGCCMNWVRNIVSGTPAPSRRSPSAPPRPSRQIRADPGPGRPSLRRGHRMSCVGVHRTDRDKWKDHGATLDCQFTRRDEVGRRRHKGRESLLRKGMTKAETLARLGSRHHASSAMFKGRPFRR